MLFQRDIITRLGGFLVVLAIVFFVRGGLGLEEFGVFFFSQGGVNFFWRGRYAIVTIGHQRCHWVDSNITFQLMYPFLKRHD